MQDRNAENGPIAHPLQLLVLQHLNLSIEYQRVVGNFFEERVPRIPSDWMCAQGREEPIGKKRMLPNIQLHIGGSADHQTILLTNALNRRENVTSTTVSRQRTPEKIKLLFVLAIVMAV